MKIKLTPTGPLFSDCTQNYRASGCEGMTVSQFIKTILEERNNEKGTFRKDWTDIESCRESLKSRVNYSKGRLLNEIPEEWKNMIVKDVLAHSSWKGFDYIISMV